jgi:O-methyltransferase.
MSAAQLDCSASKSPKNTRKSSISFDLAAVEPVAKKHIAATGLADRIRTATGDFFQDPLPKADVITMGMILHDWNLEKKDEAHPRRVRRPPARWRVHSHRSVDR